MKFRIKFRETYTNNEWFEDFEDKQVISQYLAKQAACRIVAKFNDARDTMRENPREVVAVKLVDEVAKVV